MPLRSELLAWIWTNKPYYTNICQIVINSRHYRWIRCSKYFFAKN